MSSGRPLPSRRALAWTAAVAVPAAVGAAVLVPLAASGSVDLPDLTPEQLLALAADSDVDQLSGTLEQTSALGLPDLGAVTDALGGGSSGDPGTDADSRAADVADLLELVTGTHTAKVYLDGDRARLQVLDELAERNVYVDGVAGEAWFVDSESQTATRFVAPEGSGEKPEDAPQAELPTPQEMIDRTLADLDESTEVSVGTDGRVAGRDAYELVLTPRTDDTLVGEVRFAVDGETGAALAASVTARGTSEPAFEIAFTDVDFAAPDAAALTFAPGAGITVEEKELPAWTDADARDHADKPAPPASAQPRVSGEGWATIVEIPAPAGERDPIAGLAPDQAALLDSVTTAVDGGRVLETALVTVLLTDDGRVFAGAVPADALVAAAAADAPGR
ncbi:LolA family protein [Microbacterium aurantiacum]|uniref:LolA family protein n=1 Tax=Microbacterium aurantiacum TaxID=162393 RepID=UPI00341C021F